MSGMLFYWIAWVLWIFATFLMKKTEMRTYIAVGLLLTLMFSQSVIDVAGVRVNGSVVILLIWSIIKTTHQINWIFSIFRCLCIVFGYIGLLFWEQITPIWMITSRELILPLLGLIMLSLLTQSNKEKVIIWCLGMTTGEILHCLILQSYGFHEVIGDMAFFDSLFIGFAFLSIMFIFKEMKLRIDQLIQQIEKQKKGVNP